MNGENGEKQMSNTYKSQNFFLIEINENETNNELGQLKTKMYAFYVITHYKLLDLM